MWSNTMTDSLNSNSTDEQVVNYIHEWTIERWKCGLDSDKYNQINDKHLAPAIKILENRGPASISKVLTLLQNNNPDVRLATATIAYELDTVECRKVLEDLIKTPDSVGIMAWATLAVKDPDNTPSPREIWKSPL